MRKLIWFLLPIFFCVSCSNSKSTIENHIIVSVHDGDTFTDEVNNKYRLYAVDTPEISDQFNNFETTLGMEQIYAYEAKEFVERKMLHKNVQVIPISIDKYNRKVARIIIDGQDLSQLLVENGYARVAYINVIKGSPYETKNYDYYRKILECQKKAYDNERGFWKHKNKFHIIFPKAT